MAIIITTNDGESQKQEVFETQDDINQAVQPEKIEKNTEESATEEIEDNIDKSLDYLNSTDDESDSDDDDNDDDTEVEEEKPKKSGFKKRIDKLTKEKSELKFRLEELERVVRSGNTNNNNQQQSAPVIEDLKEPDINDFEYQSEYVKALAKYEVNQERRALAFKDEEKLILEEAEKITATYRDRVNEAKKRYGENKWNSLQSIDLPLTIQMRSEIMGSELGPDILFYLYNNLDENKKINSLTPAQQIKELTKLEYKLIDKLPKKGNNTSKEKVSKAPEPVKPISSKTDGKSASKSPNDMSFQEHKAWMNEKEKNRK